MIYFIQSYKYVKIGYTKYGISRRISDMQVGNPIKLKMLGAMDGTKRGEISLHERFQSLRVRGEWFRLRPPLKEFIKECAEPEEVVSRRMRRQAINEMVEPEDKGIGLVREPVV